MCDCWQAYRRPRPATRGSAVWRPQRPRPPNGTWPTRGAVAAVAAAAVAGGAPLAVADGGGGAARPRLLPLPLRPCFGGPGGRDAVAVGVGRTCRRCRPVRDRRELRRRAPRRAALRRCRPRPRRPLRPPRPCTVAAVAVGVYPVRRTAKPKRNAHTQTTQTF